VAALVFQRPDISAGALLGLNEKMSGTLTKLVEKGAWTGERDESFLLASQNMIKADKLLFHGLGRESDYEIPVLEDGIRKLGSALDNMGVDEFGVNIPVLKGNTAEYASHLECATRHIVSPFLENHKNDPDFLLKIIFSVEKGLMFILNPVVSRLREYFTPIIDFSIIIDHKRDTQPTTSTG
jgi:hypothetical protein